jgi:O-antigen ligase
MEKESAWGRKYSDSEERVYMWYWATALFLERPFAGVGTGGYYGAMMERGAEKGMPHPHNNLLYMAVSFGLPGIAVFLWFFFALLKRGWLNRGSPAGFFVFSGGLVILVGGLVDTHVLDAGPAFLLAVLTGLQAALPRERRPEQDSTPKRLNTGVRHRKGTVL